MATLGGSQATPLMELASLPGLNVFLFCSSHGICQALTIACTEIQTCNCGYSTIYIYILILQKSYFSRNSQTLGTFALTNQELPPSHILKMTSSGQFLRTLKASYESTSGALSDIKLVGLLNEKGRIKIF